MGTCGVILHFYVFTTLIGQLVGPFGINDTHFVTDMGLFVFGFGVLGGIFFSLILTRHPDKLMLSAFVINIIAILSLAFFYIAVT